MAGESTQVVKNITRVIDRKKRVDGYYVRIQWKGKNYSKLFSIQKYDTEANALARAIEWRNETEQDIGKPRTDRLVVGVTRPTNTGLKGIRREWVQYRKRGRPVGSLRDCYIITTFDENGKLHRTSISIERYGEEKALELAKQCYEERSAY